MTHELSVKLLGEIYFTLNLLKEEQELQNKVNGKVTFI